MGRIPRVVLVLVCYTVFAIAVFLAPIEEAVSGVLHWAGALTLIGWLAATSYECRMPTFLRRR